VVSRGVFRLTRPSPAEVQRWLAALEATPLPARPASRGVVDRNVVVLGQGGDTFRRARAALERWEMFRLGWVELHPAGAPVRVGTTVAVLAHTLGLWSLNPCRIVALVEEAGPIERSGFVYRTLPGHVVDGEERFTVAWHRGDDRVAYEVVARSRPASVLVRLGFPVSRLVQRRFARDSKRAMERAVAGSARSTNQ